MPTVNEKTTSYLQVVFKDRNGDPAAPTTVIYSVHDRESGTLLAEGTPSAAATVLFTLGTAVNAMVDATRSIEDRVVTYRGIFGVGDEYNGRYIYSVVNLAHRS